MTCPRTTLVLDQWFPTFFHLRTPWQPISINCTLHIAKMFVINIAAVISNLYVVSCLTLLTCVPFSAIIHFFAYPRRVRIPEVGNHCSRPLITQYTY
jgi:hypothetical protein